MCRLAQTRRRVPARRVSQPASSYFHKITHHFRSRSRLFHAAFRQRLNGQSTHEAWVAHENLVGDCPSHIGWGGDSMPVRFSPMCKHASRSSRKRKHTKPHRFYPNGRACSLEDGCMVIVPHTAGLSTVDSMHPRSERLTSSGRPENI